MSVPSTQKPGRAHLSEQSTGRTIPYVPGYAWAKLALAIFGVVLMLASLEKLGPLMVLLVTGHGTLGEAHAIVSRDAAGQESRLLTDSEVLAAIKAGEAARDRDTAYFVEYRFSHDGREVIARSPLGQHVKPLHMLLDPDGLPATTTLWYSASDPTHVALPYQFGTWFLPGMLVFFGFLATFMGLTLWWYAHKIVDMPDFSPLPPGSAQPPQAQPLPERSAGGSPS